MDPENVRRGYGTTPPVEQVDTPVGSRFRMSQETKDDLKEIVKLSLTIVAVNLVSNVVSPISIMFIGQLGVVELDGVNLASTAWKFAHVEERLTTLEKIQFQLVAVAFFVTVIELINCTGFAVSGGMTSAADTLIAQAKGSNNNRKVGIYFQQSLMIIMLFVLPVWAIHLNAESFLRLMGQDPEVCRIAGEYLTMTIPAMFFSMLYRVLFSYLRSIGYLLIPLMAGAVGTGVNILLHYLLVIQFPIGVAGSAIAQDCSYLVMVIISAGMMFKGKVYEGTWYGWSMESFQYWGSFLSMGLAGFGIWFLEYLGCEMGAILTGLLGPVELGAQSIIYQYYLVIYSVPFGFGIGCNVRIAQILGAGDGKRARKNAKHAALINAALAFGIIIFTLALEREIPKVFSNDQEVIDYTSSVIPIFCIHLVMDSPLVVSSGILRGCGRHGTGVIVFLAGYFLIACPLSIVLMFVVKIGVAGFWVSTSIGLFITNTTATLYIFCCLDWDKAAEMTQRTLGVLPSKELERRDSIAADDPESQLYDSDETIGLLTYRDLARHKTEARWRRFQMANVRALNLSPHSGMNVGEVVNVTEEGRLSGFSLFWRRAGFISIMFLILLVAVLTRLFLTPSIIKPMSDLCIPFNSSITNSFLPFCNTSVPMNLT